MRDSRVSSAGKFQSTHPARGATLPAQVLYFRLLFQSTHPARGATFLRGSTLLAHYNFNPRTPRGVRLAQLCVNMFKLNFNPRTPRGVRQVLDLAPGDAIQFQSTHPARGATSSFSTLNKRCKNFNPRTPRGVRREPSTASQGHSSISIHAPREGCDVNVKHHFYHPPKFQSTHPARGATWTFVRTRFPNSNFNPRTPRGVRQQTLPKSREFAWLNLLICTRGRRLSIRKQTRLCSMKLSFMLFGCEPAGEGVSSWTSHATKSKVRLEGRSAYSQSVRSSAHSDFPGNKSGGCPVRDP